MAGPFHQDSARKTGCPRQRGETTEKNIPSLVDSTAQLESANTLVSRAICQRHGDRYW